MCSNGDFFYLGLYMKVMKILCLVLLFPGISLYAVVDRVVAGSRLWDNNKRINDELSCDILIYQTDIPYTVTASGNYCLAQDVTIGAGDDGITISANDVELDLNGHRLDGAGSADNGVVLSVGADRITVKNGFVSGSSISGIQLLGNQNVVIDGLIISEGQFTSRGIRLEDCNYVSIKNCDVVKDFSTGIDLLDSNELVVTKCHISNCTNGIQASEVQLVVDNCIMTNCSIGFTMPFTTGTGEDVVLRDCLVADSGIGFRLFNSDVFALRCIVKNSSSGFLTSTFTSNYTYVECQAIGNSQQGFSSPSNNVVYKKCIAHDNGLNGFAVSGLAQNIHFLDCESINNGSDGFSCSNTAVNILFKGCVARDNSGDCFETVASGKYMNNVSIDNGGLPFSPALTDATKAISYSSAGVLAGANYWINVID